MDSISDPDIHTVVVMSSAQVGKALCIDTPILTTAGWVTMGDLQIGDKVFDPNGDQVTVTFATDVMVNRKCYKVTFSDHSSLVADADHQWGVYDTGISNQKNEYCVKTTKEILIDYKNGNRNRYRIPITKPLKMAHATLPIDPYWLGVWLGDGHSSSSTISVGEQDVDCMTELLRQIDPYFTVDTDGSCFAIKYRRRFLPLRDSKTMQSRLSDLGLIKNKHIPSQYLLADYDQRLAIIQGLMDTDGYIDHRGRCEFVTTSVKISEGFGELLSSIGIKYTRTEKIPTTTYKGEKVNGKKAYRFSFMAYDDKPIFALPRKLKKMVSRDGKRHSETEARRVIDVSEVASVPVRCIQVDSDDHLYLAGKELIPTHNTEILLNAIGYYAHQDPSPILLLQPTLEMAETFSKDRLAPMVRDTPALTDRFAPAKSKGSGNTLRHKTFTGGHITMAGANSPSSLASRPIRVCLLDEVDRYPASAGTEGDPVNLARKRTTTFHNRKMVLTSTPTIKGISRIETAYEEGDQRKYHLQCPHCETYHVPAWANVQWAENQPHEAAYVCPDCGVVWSERDRVKAIYNGKWVANAEFYGIASFHLSELISPWSTPASMAVAFLQAKKGGAEMLKTWVNTVLGETWEEDGEQADPDALIGFAERFDVEWLPDEIKLLTAGVDTQDDRLEAQLIGWSDGGIPYIIQHDILWGDTNKAEVWNQLDKWLSRTICGHKITQTYIDSGGHSTETVYQFTKKRHGRRIFPIKGEGGQKEPVSRAKQTAAQRVMLVKVGIDPLKRTLLGWLKEAGQLIHFSHTLDDEFYRQLTAEKMVIKKVKGFPRIDFVKTRDRNEALDCFVYGYAAMIALNVNWSALDKKEQPEEKEPIPLTPLQEYRQRSNTFPRKRRNSFAKSW